jgi:UDP-N-acetylmuramate--alanine ligase
VLLMLDIYSASESPIEGIDSKSLCRSIRQRGKVDPIYVGQAQQLYAVFEDILKDQDIVFLQGAGNVGNIAQNLADNKFDLSLLRNL